GTAIASSAPVVNRGYLFRQFLVIARVLRGAPSLAGVVATGRDSHDTAENGDGEGHLLLGDERELHAFSLAKNVAACFKISRSLRRTFTSRRRCESSSFSAVVRAPGAPLPSSTSACRHQSYTRLFASPNSSATCGTLRPPLRTSATVSALNLRVCTRRVRLPLCADMWSPFYAHFPERGVHQTGSVPHHERDGSSDGH